MKFIYTIIGFIFIQSAWCQKNTFSNKKELDSLNLEIIKLNNQISNYTSEIEKCKREKQQVIQLKATLIDYNNYFELLSSLEDIYTTDFFLTCDFQKLDKDEFEKIHSANLIARGLFYSDHNPKFGQDVLDFNRNRVILDSLTRQVLEKSYDSLKVESALRELANLPPVRTESKINAYKTKFKLLLSSYSEKNCKALQEYTILSKNLSNLIIQGSDKNKFKQDRSKWSRVLVDIPKEYEYLHRVFDAILQDPANFQKPDYVIPDNCPPPLEKELNPPNNSNQQENNK